MPDVPAGLQCNAERADARSGGYLIGQMMERHMLIEVDHLSERARETVLRRGYSEVVSSSLAVVLRASRSEWASAASPSG